MEVTLNEYYQSLKTKSNQFFNPEFFGLYSFEYAYRLLLVYLSTQKTTIKGIRMSKPDALDHAFEEDIKNAIGYTTAYRGISVDESLLTALLRMANDSAVLFLKSSMNNSPIDLAKKVTHAMDQAVADNLGGEAIAQKVFSED